MVWFKVDDDLHAHPKARAAGLQAMGLWAVAGSWSTHYLTEGFIPTWYVQGWPSGAKLAAKLVEVSLWHKENGGWRFHEWELRQTPKATVIADRAKTAARVARWRSNAASNAVGNGVTEPVRNAPSNGAPHHTTPVSTSLVTENGGGASNATSATPPPKCAKHETPDHDQPCRACKRVREYQENKPTARDIQRAAAITARANCPLCDDKGFVLGTDDNPRKCNHPTKGNTQ